MKGLTFLKNTRHTWKTLIKLATNILKHEHSMFQLFLHC